MGLFDIFKKKPEPVRNNPNSVFTLRFAVPYFPVFDKTNPKLKSFPVKLSCAGSVQYRISEPDLCFDNVSLGNMSAAQLEEHVKDALISSVKHFINSIDYMPLLQFETEMMRINDAAKEYLVPQFADEYGINLRAFTLTRISYDEEDPNYQRLCQHSAKLADKLNSHELEDVDMDRDIEKKRRSYREEAEIYENEHRKRLRNLEAEEALAEREANLRLRKQAAEHELKRNSGRLEREMQSEEIDLERKCRELDEDMHARRTATDNGAKLAQSLSQRATPGLGVKTSAQSTEDKPKKGNLDLGSL